MQRFNVNETPDLDFIEVKKKVKSCQAAQIDDSFEVGTKSGIAQGAEGDWLFIDNGVLSVVKKEDFESGYEVVKSTKKPTVKKDEEKEEKPEPPKKEKKEVKKPVTKKKITKKPTSKKKVVKKGKK